MLSFPLNALLKSSDLDASESLGFKNALGAGEEYSSLENESSDEANTCGEAFAILKQLVERWVQDCADENNQLPILLTRNLQRWLQRSASYIRILFAPQKMRLLNQCSFVFCAAEWRSSTTLPLRGY